MIYASSAATYGDSDRFEVGYENQIMHMDLVK